MEFTDVLSKLLRREDIEESEASFALDEIMQGKTNSSQIAAFLTALRIKGETVAEIVGLAKAMRKHTKHIALNPALKTENLVDTAGTGGDGSSTFNISTAAAFVAAGAGAVVAKHGNRAASSRSGSADVVEALGVNIEVDVETAKEQLERIGVAFLFARTYHPAIKSVACVRKELGFKTIFNILGPLTNPAGAKRQVIGVYDKELMKKMAEAARALGTEKMLLVSSDIDEVSVSTETHVIEVSGNMMDEYIVKPEDFGVIRGKLGDICVADKTESGKMMLAVLEGKTGAARDVVLLNAGAAIYASGIAKTMADGVELAKRSIDSGKAMEKLEQLKNNRNSVVG